jgi:coenzyme F420 hydrogenase subunit beta
MTLSSPTLARVVGGDLCSGCGLCAGVAPDAIAMTTVAPGYARPAQTKPLSAAQERLIASSCPGETVAGWADGAAIDPYWGPSIRVLTGHATDPVVRHAGSSGGALTALAIHALTSGLVDRVVHVEADPDQPTRNRLCWSDQPAQILAGAGSRYAASSPLAQIDQFLSQGQRFAFIGKPCDISALRRLALVDARVDALVPVMLAFFCAGMPSHAGADRIVRDMGLNPAELTSFRYRGNGWPGLTRAETADGQVGEMRYADSWGGHLSRHVQFRCKICPDAVGGVADIAAADAWYGGDSGYPTFDEEDGRSLIMTRTRAGERLLDSALRAQAIVVTPLDIGEIMLMQPAQARRKRAVAGRLAALALVGRPRPRMAGLALLAAARRASVMETARNFAGTLRRVVARRRAAP